MNPRELSAKAARHLRAHAARTAALLPGSSITFGPPRREAPSTSIADTTTVIHHQIVPARQTVRPVPELADAPLGDMIRRPCPASIKEIFVAELPQGRYWGRYHGYVVDRTDTLLTDLSPTVMQPGKRHDGLEQLKLPPLREMSGTVAVINTLYASNFHHWLLDTLPRFEWLRRAGFAWDKIDHFILPSDLLRFHHDTLKMLGLDMKKVILSEPQMHLRAERLLVPCHSEPSHNPGAFDYTPEGLHFVRELVLTNNPFLQKSYPKRLIVSREKAASRRLVQAEKANRLLAAQGFEKVLLEDYSLHEQAAMFAQADCVVMPTGGNLANFVFCRPGTVAVELFSHSYVPPFTFAFMDTIGLRYYGVVTHAVSRPRPDARGNHEDIDVDPDRLDRIIRNALAKGKPTG
jgi:hypothetical protein